MPYTPTAWVNGSTPYINATNLLKIEAALTWLAGMSVSVKDPAYGAVGNGTTNDATAFTNAATAAAAGGGVLVIPPGTYAMGASWDLPSNLTVFGYGATLKATSAGSSTRVITSSNKSNIKIYGLTINGDKASFGTTTEQRHGIYLLGCSNVVLEDVTSSSNKGDGIYLGAGVSACSGIQVNRGMFNANHRNGMSVVACTSSRFIDTDFTNTSGTAPQDGVDIEPNLTTDTVTDLLFRGCKMTSNTGDGLGINRISTGVTPTLARIRFEHCIFKSNSLRGVMISYGQGRFDFISCENESNGGHGYAIEPTANMADINIRGGLIRSNLRIAVKCTPAASINLARVRVSDVDIVDNSTEGAGTWDGILLSARTTYATITGNLIANTVGGVGMDNPVWTEDTTVTDLTLVGNRYETISAVSLSDSSGSRVNTGNG